MNSAPAQTARTRQQSAGLMHKIGSVLFIFFCFEVGAFLVLFPWLEPWQSNYFAGLVPGWDSVWSSAYFRGAVSGLGIINIGISFSELFRLRRFSGGGEQAAGSSKEVL